MRPRFPFVVLIALSAAGACRAQVPPAVPASQPASRVAAYAASIAGLESDDFARREAAMQALSDAGEPAREALMAARDTGSPERRLRVAELLGRLDVRTAGRAASRPLPPITLAPTKRPLAEVCRELTAATGAVIRIPSEVDAAREITVDVRDATFFTAFEAVRMAAGLQFIRDQLGVFTLQPVVRATGPVALAGPLRVAATSVTLTASTQFGGAAQVYASLGLHADLDPRLGAIGLMYPMVVTAAEDERGRPLLPTQQQMQSFVQRLSASQAMESNVQLAPPDLDSTRIKTLAFTVRVVVPSELFEVEVKPGVDTPENPVGQGALKVWLKSVQAEGRRTAISLEIQRPTATGEGAGQNPITVDDIVVITGDGRTVTPTEAMTSMSDGKLTWRGTVPSADIAAVRVTALKSYRTVDVPVIIHDIPLR